jgi:hypothetical protein
MASGSYAKKPVSRELPDIQTKIPPRATRKLQDVEQEEDEPETSGVRSTISRALQLLQPAERERETISWRSMPSSTLSTITIVDEHAPHPLKHHWVWLNPLIISIVCVVVGSGVLLSAAIMQRPGQPAFVNFLGGKVYSVQVGGDLAGSWQANGPLPPKVPLASNPGPYSVLGKPTITAAFINEVLAAYNSPAAGKGQALYDLGVQYGIDPIFALAFFMHESTFGTQGEARYSLSLGNLRCIPNFECRDNFAWFPSWEAGFQAWYSLIRNLYVADWGLTTVDQIIPRYAPPGDNNDDSGYIAAVKHAIDTWHTGILRP